MVLDLHQFTRSTFFEPLHIVEKLEAEFNFWRFTGTPNQLDQRPLALVDVAKCRPRGRMRVVSHQIFDIVVGLESHIRLRHNQQGGRSAVMLASEWPR